MFCSISEETPQEPVVSKSGHIFEKRLIEKHIRSTGSCPVTKEALSLEDLTPLQIKTPFRPRPPSLSSMPAMLQTVQNEWDAVMLETYQAKQQLVETRKLLAKALYENDAAYRVIGRLIGERDEALAALAELKGTPSTSAPASGGEAMEIDSKEDVGMTADVIAKLDASHKALSKGRRKRTKARAQKVAKPQAVAAYTATSFSPHSSTHPGILCLGLHPTNQNLSVTGGKDSNVVLFDRSEGKILDTLKHHRKKVNDVAFVGATDVIVSASADATAVIWGRGDRGYTPRSVLSCHSDEVVSCAVHPSNEYLVTASKDKTWALHDIATGKLRNKSAEGDLNGGILALAFHPDGGLMGACTSDKMVSMLDLKTAQIKARLPGHSARLSALAFSENGTYLATGDESGVVKLWDLRTVQCFKTLSQGMSTVTSLSFDTSGSYLGVGGEDVRLFSTSTWDVVKEWKDHRSTVTSVRFADGVSMFATTSLDRTVKFWAPAN